MEVDKFVTFYLSKQMSAFVVKGFFHIHIQAIFDDCYLFPEQGSMMSKFTKHHSSDDTFEPIEAVSLFFLR